MCHVSSEPFLGLCRHVTKCDMGQLILSLYFMPDVKFSLALFAFIQLFAALSPQTPLRPLVPVFYWSWLVGFLHSIVSLFILSSYFLVASNYIRVYDGTSKSFRAESITKYRRTFGITCWEATQRVMAAKLTRLTHKIAIQLCLVAENCTICSSRSRRPVRKLLDIPSYMAFCMTWPWHLNPYISTLSIIVFFSHVSLLVSSCRILSILDSFALLIVYCFPLSQSTRHIHILKLS
jgi:hypothetical protein